VRIYNEQNQIRSLHGDVRLNSDLLFKSIVDVAANTASVDESARDLRGLGWRSDAISGDAGLVVDNGDLPPGKAIKES
jgi:hypothetical protein